MQPQNTLNPILQSLYWLLKNETKQKQNYIRITPPFHPPQAYSFMQSELVRSVDVQKKEKKRFR